MKPTNDISHYGSLSLNFKGIRDDVAQTEKQLKTAFLQALSSIHSALPSPRLALYPGLFFPEPIEELVQAALVSPVYFRRLLSQRLLREFVLQDRPEFLRILLCVAECCEDYAGLLSTGHLV